MNFLLKINRTRGFTLIEFIIVLAIILILVAISISALSGFIDDASNRSRTEEAGAVAESAKSAVENVYKLGTPVEEINSDSKAAQNLRKRILEMSGSSGEIVSFHVSDGSKYNFAYESAKGKPAPMHLNFTKAGTLEYLEYESSDGKWYGQYRVLEDYEAEVRILNYSLTNANVTVKND